MCLARTPSAISGSVASLAGQLAQHSMPRASYTSNHASRYSPQNVNQNPGEKAKCCRYRNITVKGPIPILRFDEPEDEQLSLKLWQALMERLVNAVGGPLCSTLLVADSLEIIAHACCALSKLSAANSTAQVQGPTGASPYPGTHTLVHVSPMGDIKIIICLLTKCISCEVDITGRLSATVVWSPFKNVSERIFLGSDCSYVLHDFVG